MRGHRHRGPCRWGATLDAIAPGYIVLIRSLGGSPAFQDRLRNMGFREGASVEIVKQAPLADPLEYCIGPVHISLRREEARLIGVSNVRARFGSPPGHRAGECNSAQPFPGRCMRQIRRWMRGR